MSTLLWGMVLGMVLAVLLGLLLVWAWESEWAQKMAEEQESWLLVDSRKAMQQARQRVQGKAKEAGKENLHLKQKLFFDKL
jgi:hypothetical protein